MGLVSWMDGARVLELVDQHQVDLFAELLASRFFLEKLQRLGLLVHKVDHTEAPLVRLVRLEHVRGRFEDSPHCTPQVIVQTRMPIVCSRGLPDGISVGLRLLSRVELREVRPLAPRKVASAACECRACALAGCSGLLGGVCVEIDVRKEAFERRFECSIQRIGVGRGGLQEPEERVGAAFGELGEAIRTDSVGTCEIHDPNDVLLPVPFARGHDATGVGAHGAHPGMEVFELV